MVGRRRPQAPADSADLCSEARSAEAARQLAGHDVVHLGFVIRQQRGTQLGIGQLCFGAFSAGCTIEQHLQRHGDRLHCHRQGRHSLLPAALACQAGAETEQCIGFAGRLRSHAHMQIA